MMRFVSFLFLIAFLFSCGISKKKTAEVKPIDPVYIQAFHEAVRYKIRGQFDESIKAFEKCLTLRQDDDAVYYALSQLHLMKNEQEKSADYIRQAALADPNNIWYSQELAYMFFETGNYAEAIKHFEKLVKYEPRNVEWLYGYAESLVKAGKIGDAIKAYDKMEDQIGKHPELGLQKFKLYLQLKQDEKALNEINEARKEFPQDPQLIAALVDYYFQKGKEDKAIEMLEELIKADPDNGRAHLALADIYRQKGQQKKAYTYLIKAFACQDVTIDNKMQILINILDNSYKIDPEVFELVELTVQHHPTEAKAHSIRGDYMLRVDRDDEALISYKEALKYDKSIFPIWNQVLVMLYQNGDFNELYNDSKDCLNYFSTQPQVYLLLGVGANQLKKYDEAIDGLKTGLDFLVNDKAIEAEFNGQLGEAYFGKKELAKAKEYYDKALKLDPKSTLLRNNYAYRLALAKTDIEKALGLMDFVQVSNDQSPNFMDTKGFILFQMGKYPEAKLFFERAYKLNPKDKVIVEHMGDIYFKLGDKDLAVELWKEAKDKGSVNQVLDKKIEKKEYYDPIY
jgi:tetratricopeptide (TPR) repeat protein